MKYKNTLIWLLFAVFWLSACVPAGTPVVEPAGGQALAEEPFRSEQGGFSIRYPVGWQATPAGAGLGVRFTPSQEGTETPGGSVMDVSLAVVPRNTLGTIDENSGAREILQSVVDGISSDPNENVEFDEFEEVSAGGYTGVASNLQGEGDGQGLAGRVVLLTVDTRVALLLGIGPAGQWEEFVPTYEIMLRSLEFFEPQQ